MLRNLKHATFKDDFPDIVRARLAKRKRKMAESEERRKKIAALTHRTYSRLVTALSDLVSHRVETRMAFNKWLEGLQLLSKAVVQPPNYTGLRRSESKYRARGLTTFGSQFNAMR